MAARGRHVILCRTRDACDPYIIIFLSSRAYDAQMPIRDHLRKPGLTGLI